MNDNTLDNISDHDHGLRLYALERELARGGDNWFEFIGLNDYLLTSGRLDAVRAIANYYHKYLDAKEGNK